MGCLMQGPPGLDPNSEGCKQDWFDVGNTTQGIWRSVLRWDVTDIPPLANVTNVDMKLGVWSAPAPPGLDISVHQLTQGYTRWVTWDTYDGENAWDGGPAGSSRRTRSRPRP